MNGGVFKEGRRIKVLCNSIIVSVAIKVNLSDQVSGKFYQHNVYAVLAQDVDYLFLGLRI